MKKIIIAIDGFSSTGKSTLAKLLAQQLQYVYVDSGAMYRAVALYVLQNNLTNGSDLKTDQLIHKLPLIKVTFENNKVLKSSEVYIKRNDPRDVFVSFKHSNFKDLKDGVMGSSSRRRDLQLKLINKDILVKNIRGNIDTRIKKLNDGLYDAIILSYANATINSTKTTYRGCVFN